MFSVESAGGTLEEEGALLRFLAVVRWMSSMGVRTSGLVVFGPKHSPSETLQPQHSPVIIFLLSPLYRHPVQGIQEAPGLLLVLAPILFAVTPSSGVAPVVLSMLCSSQPHIPHYRDIGPPPGLQEAWCPTATACPCTGHHLWLTSHDCMPEGSFLPILWLQTSSGQQISKLLCHSVGSNTHFSNVIWTMALGREPPSKFVHLLLS